MADAGFSLYPYDPIEALPIVFSVIVAVAGAALFYQSVFRYRWYHFGWATTFASLVWLTGFISRAISVRQPGNINLFIVQYVFIVAGPPLFGATEYIVLSRLLSYLPYHSPVHPSTVLRFFLLLSAAVEALTGNGAARTATEAGVPPAQRLGPKLIQAALILQSAIEILFCATVALVEHRVRRAGRFPRHVRRVVYVLYVTSFMLLVRCVVRVIESFQSARCTAAIFCGPLATHEWVLWVFEVANITLFIILLAVFHPGRYLPRDKKVFLDPIDGVTERYGPGFESRRGKWRRLLGRNTAKQTEAHAASMEKFWEKEYPVYVQEL